LPGELGHRDGTAAGALSREAESQARWLRSICAELAFMDCPGAQAVVNASIGAWQLVVAHRECGG
jgi:hypothetical protein